MTFNIKKGEKKSNIIDVTPYHSFILFGFTHSIGDLTLVFEEKDGQLTRIALHDTSVGFANDSIRRSRKAWFEFSDSDKDYEITAQVE